MPTRLLCLPVAVVLAFTIACAKYKGKDVCDLLTPEDIAAVIGEPFLKGSKTLLANDSDQHIGSECVYDSVARAPDNPKEAKFRIVVEATYVEPAQASTDAARKEWERFSDHGGKPLYTKIHEVNSIGDAAIVSTGNYRNLIIWSLIKPSTKVQVDVFNVVENEAEDRGRRIAEKMISLIRSEQNRSR